MNNIKFIKRIFLFTSLMLSYNCNRNGHKNTCNKSTATTEMPTFSIPPEVERFNANVSQSIIGIAEIGATEVFCQGIAVNNNTVLLPKHCLSSRGVFAILPSTRKEILLDNYRLHPTLDIAKALSKESMPLSVFPQLPQSCSPSLPVVSACIWPRSAHKLGLHREEFSLNCDSTGICLTKKMKLVAGASGCPVFDNDEITLRAIGFGWSGLGSHFVCVTEKLFHDL